jgi:hypothetical protein
LTETLNNYSNHDAERLKKYAFSGKTVGDLVARRLKIDIRAALQNRQWVDCG